MNRWIALALALAALDSQGGPLALPPVPAAGFEPQLGAVLPLHLQFIDETGRMLPLRRYFGARPVVLVLGYYHCPNLCSITLEGVTGALAALRLAPDSYRLLGVSIDPGETAALAARRQASLPPLHGGDLHLLTGDASAIAQLAGAAGFRYRYDAASGQYAHPAGFLLATPDGVIARYFEGVRFEPEALKAALADAGAGRVGATPVERLLLLCAHYDPALGRHSAAVMNALRLMGAALVAGLLLAWRAGSRR